MKYANMNGNLFIIIIIVACGIIAVLVTLLLFVSIKR